jgi:hypothetical protein
VAVSDRLVVSTVSVTVVLTGVLSAQVFVVAAAHAGDRVGQRLMPLTRGAVVVTVPVVLPTSMVIV